jgi:hypothetical protein
MQQLQDLAGKTEEAANNMQGRIFATIQHHWGTGVEQPEAISTFNAYRISIPLGSFMGACRVLAGHAMVFLEAQ